MKKLMKLAALAAITLCAAMTTSCDKDEAPFMLTNTTWAGTNGTGEPVSLYFPLLASERATYQVADGKREYFKYRYVQEPGQVTLLGTYNGETFLEGTVSRRKMTLTFAETGEVIVLARKKTDPPVLQGAE